MGMNEYRLDHFFDNAAATPIGIEAQKIIANAGELDFVNPSGLTMASSRTKGMLNDARHQITKLIGAQPMGCTQSLVGCGQILQVVGVGRDPRGKQGTQHRHQQYRYRQCATP